MYLYPTFKHKIVLSDFLTFRVKKVQCRYGYIGKIYQYTKKTIFNLTKNYNQINKINIIDIVKYIPNYKYYLCLLYTNDEFYKNYKVILLI